METNVESVSLDNFRNKTVSSNFRRVNFDEQQIVETNEGKTDPDVVKLDLFVVGNQRLVQIQTTSGDGFLLEKAKLNLFTISALHLINRSIFQNN